MRRRSEPTRSVPPTTRTMAKAISPTTSTLRRRMPGGCSPLRSRRPSPMRARTTCSTGARPKSRPVTSATASPKARTRPSTATSAARGTDGGAKRWKSATEPQASAAPRAPAARAVTRLSVRSCRTTRARPAPSAARTAISRPRSVARISERLATLAHATSRSRPTAARNGSSVWPNSPTVRSCNGRSPTERASGGTPRSRRSSSSAAWSCSAATPARMPPRSRATTCRNEESKTSGETSSATRVSGM